uniref:Uncharacterized protein AlNc14C11G1346 n=1 Tax=Albugo laibachii Nc14 TaxID=890382 RepID=F0W2W8_9STRA|nr:conserved hypothetical protein [Albugo laibachii Nc14]|eukprot:CCA15404.1 conserved hypothetical protein [Albugo laibachii Nc14]
MKVCLWCWHQIKNEYNGLCPACRMPYLEAPKQTQVRVDREVSLNIKTKVKKQKEKVERRAVVSVSKTPPTVNNRALADIRVMQRNLVYVIGLPEHYADEEKLRSQELFGQYGRIIKAVVNKSHLNLDRQHTTVSAYITFAEKEDALSCIHVVDGYLLDGSPLRVSFGTTKYCNFFLRNAQCTNSECLYLHELGDENDSFTKEEMHAVLHAGRGTFREATATGTSSTESRAGSSLPPPVNRSISRESSPIPAIERTRNSVGTFRADGAGLVTANAQRKAQSAAAITKLKRSHEEKLVFRAVSKNTTSPSRKRAQPYSTIAAGVTTPSPERLPANDAGTHGFSNGCSDQNISPTERRKRVTDYHPTRTAWSRPFSAGFILPKANPNDLNAANMTTVFGPLEQGTHTLLPSEIEQTTWKPPTIDTTSSLLRPLSAPLSDFSTSSTLTTTPVETPCTTSSFASIDAIFSQRNESSEALASLLGVKLCPRPLHHGSSTEPISTVRTSRFAFANQPSKTVTGFPSSTLEQRNTLVDRKFKSLGHRPLHVHSHYLCGENASTLDASSYQNAETLQNSQNSLGNSNPDSGHDDGLAYLQSMLPNVNISFGGEYSGTAAPGVFLGNSMISQSQQSDRTLQNNVWADRPNRAQHTAPFHDPAIVIPDPATSIFHSVRSSSRQSRTH